MMRNERPSRTVRRRALLALVCASLLAIVLPTSQALADANAPLGLAGCNTTALEAGEDAFAEVALPFAINAGDVVVVDGVAEPALETTIFVSENGVLSFDFAVQTFDDPRGSVRNIGFGSTEVIAPLYADATRTQGGTVTYGAATYAGNDAFCVRWVGVSPFIPDFVGDDPNESSANTFEVVIVDRSDRNDGDVDIITNYDSIEWDESYCNTNFFEGPNDIDLEQFGQGCCDFDFEQEIPCCDIEFEEECGPIFAPPGAAAIGIQQFGDNTAAAVAGVSFDFNSFVEFAGSGVVGEMVDPGLAQTSLNSIQAGRHIVEVVNGFGDDSTTVFGPVISDDLAGQPAGSPVAGALVEVCGQVDDNGGQFDCALARTDADGFWQASGLLPNTEYTITAFGPAGTDLFPSSITHTTSSFGGGFDDIEAIELNGPQPPADGVDIVPSRSGGLGTTLYWNDTLTLSAEGCVGGTATWVITAEDGGPFNGTLAEVADGSYSAEIPPLFPAHGNGTVSITIACPDPADDVETDFNIYIDPSGTIYEVHSGEPLSGVTATLFRGDLEVGPFEVVPDGSDIMSPSNRTNPDVTTDDGRFGWDVIAGFYVVEVNRADCDAIALADGVMVPSPSDAAVMVPAASETPVLEVQPEWLGLELFLDCNNPPTIGSNGPQTVEAPFTAGQLDQPLVGDPDPADVPALVVDNDAPDSFPLGDTTVTWTVTDPDGLSATSSQVITVVDTTAPTLNVPANIFVESTDGNPVAVDFTATATDSVDPNPSVECDPASGSSFAVGSTIVSCTATDASGNADNADFDVTVTLVAVGDSVRDEVRAAADAVESIESDNRLDRIRLRRAGWYLNYVDQDRYWRDDNQVNDRNGWRAMLFMRYAVSYLDAVDDEVAEAAMNDVLDALRSLAANKVDEAVAAGADQRYIDRANDRIADGDEFRPDQVGRAGNRYRSAWSLARWGIARAAG